MERRTAGLLGAAACIVLALALLGLTLVDADSGGGAAPTRAASAGAVAVGSAHAAHAADAPDAQVPPAAAVSAGSSSPSAEASAARGAARSAQGQSGPQSFSPCTDADAPDFDVSCLPDGTVGQLLRQLCDYLWLEGLCASTAFVDPGYATAVDPSPDQPLAWRVGAVHNHSGYSDGDPARLLRGSEVRSQHR